MRGIVIAGTNSGCGKTTITLGIMAALKKKGLTVQPFKTGPDFIDTGLHRLITGRTSRNLDLWMCGRDYVSECFSQHSADADISVVEGVMGMYDGNISTADLAAALGLPVVLVVDAYGMAESAGAVVKGFKEYSAEAGKRVSTEVQNFRTSELPNFQTEIAGVIFNRIASDRHYRRVRDSVQEVPVLGYLPRDMDFNIPHRHLGLVVAEESPIQPEEIDKLADTVLRHIDIEKMIQETGGRRQEAGGKPPTPTPSIKIAVAYDKAFCFYYEDNLDLLRQAGAEIVTFSPLTDSRIPDNIDAVYIGGGYPELYSKELSANVLMLESVKRWSDEGRPLYAECGGFMYLTEGIYDFDNVLYPMCGIFPFKAMMKKGRASLGYREAALKERTILGKKGELVRGHEFHYSEIVESAEVFTSKLPNFPASPLTKIYSVKNGQAEYIYDEGYRVKNTLGSYIHIHFGSNLTIAESFIDFIKECHGKDHYCGARQSQERRK